jgi:hypothetical protein
MSVAMFRAPMGFTPKSTSGFVTILAARKQGLPAVLSEATARREHPGLSQHAMWALGDLMLAAAPEEAEASREEVVLAVLETMRAHRNHGAIQLNAIRALDAANSSADSSTEMVAREGAVAAVIAAMTTHADCRTPGWQLLVKLGEYQSLLKEEEAAREEEGEAGAEQPGGDGTAAVDLVLSVLRAMIVHLPRLNVQEAGMAALCAVISSAVDEMSGAEVAESERVAAAEAIIGAEGVATVLKSLQTHAAQDGVQRGGLRLLRACCEASERNSAFTGRAVAVHSGGIGAVLDALRGCVRVAASLADGLVGGALAISQRSEQALGGAGELTRGRRLQVVMAAVALASEEGHVAMVQAGGIRVAMQSAQCHESELAVQCVGLRLLAALAALPAVVPALLSEGAMRTLLHGLRVHAAADAPTAAAVSNAFASHPPATHSCSPG